MLESRPSEIRFSSPKPNWIMPVAYTNATCEIALRAALNAKGLRYVGVRGNTKAPVCVIGEAPGKDEDVAGIPFVGASGWLLDQMLKEVGFDANDVWFTNPFKSRPPDNDIKRIGELGIELSLFLDQFFEELRATKPTIIVACGKTPTNILCPETKPKKKGKNVEEKEGFGSWRGSLLTSPFLDWPHYVLPMYHPAFVLRNYAEREICVFILTRAHEEFTYWQTMKTLNSLPKRTLVVNPSFGESYDFLRRCVGSPQPISIDIELLRRRVPYTISFALSPQEAISLSLWNYQTTQLVTLWRQMDEIFSTKVQIGQNYTSFDSHWLRALGFRVNLSLVEDTLIRHHVLWPGLRHKLEFQGMQYTREPYWKEEGHTWSFRDPIEKLMRYNALDAAVTYEVYLEQEKEFNERH
jgi:uracil-DNA glycosylase family 4